MGQKATAISPNDPRVVQIIGEADVFMGKTDDALTNLQEYVALRPGGDRIARVYWLMGECYIRLKEFQNADISISTGIGLWLLAELLISRKKEKPAPKST